MNEEVDRQLHLVMINLSAQAKGRRECARLAAEEILNQVVDEVCKRESRKLIDREMVSRVIADQLVSEVIGDTLHQVEPPKPVIFHETGAQTSLSTAHSESLITISSENSSSLTSFDSTIVSNGEMMSELHSAGMYVATIDPKHIETSIFAKTSLKNIKIIEGGKHFIQSRAALALENDSNTSHESKESSSATTSEILSAGEVRIQKIKKKAGSNTSLGATTDAELGSPGQLKTPKNRAAPRVEHFDDVAQPSFIQEAGSQDPLSPLSPSIVSAIPSPIHSPIANDNNRYQEESSELSAGQKHQFNTSVEVGSMRELEMLVARDRTLNNSAHDMTTIPDSEMGEYENDFSELTDE